MKRRTFIHNDIHDFRTPIVVPHGWLSQLVGEKVISKEELEAAEKGQRILVLGYEVVTSKPLAFTTANENTKTIPNNRRKFSTHH